MLVITTWDNTLRTMRTCTMTRMDLFGAEWRCVLEGGMGQCVMTSGTMRMPLWSADNWDSPPMVSGGVKGKLHRNDREWTCVTLLTESICS